MSARAAEATVANRPAGADSGTSRRRSLRVALLLESDGPGGAEVMLLQLGTELRARGHTVVPVGPAHGCGWLAERWRERGFEPETFSLRRPLDFGCLRGLVRTLKAHEIDVIHSHEFTMAVYGTAAAKILRRPHVITHHSNPYFARRRRRRLAMRWACRHSAAVVAVSHVTRRELESACRLEPGRVRVIYNGVPARPGDRRRVREEVRAADDEVLVLALGTLEPHKGHRLLLEALAALRRRRPDLRWRAVIAGQDRCEGAALRALAQTQGIGERVHLLGYRADVPDLIAAADLFAMPSLHEGLPMALLEAMMAGVPVLASDAGGIPEVIRHAGEGRIVPRGDVAALERELEDLLANASLRRELGAAGRARAEAAFSLDAMVGAYESLYHDVHTREER